MSEQESIANIAKARMREDMRRHLKGLPEAEVALASGKICEAIRAHEFWQEARVVGLFYGMTRLYEPSITGLMEPGRTFAFPRVGATGVMDFCVVNDLVHLTLQDIVLPDGKRISLVQPDPRLPVLDLEKLDLVLVPGLAFSRDGQRLGRGGGYYDRLLVRLSLWTKRIGVGLRCQLLDALPAEGHDQLMDDVIVM